LYLLPRPSQHHHQHRVQPISDTVHQREQHETVVAPEVTKEVRAEMAPEKAQLLEGLKAQHKDTRTVGQTEHTASSIGATVQEHAVHHVRLPLRPSATPPLRWLNPPLYPLCARRFTST
jgi:hypothetical protein